MSEIEDLDSPATGRLLPRSSAGIILDDADRAFLYRVLSIHARAGLGPAASLAAVEDALSERRPNDPTPQAALRRRADGARALATGLARGGATLDAAIESAGLRLGPLERACLRLDPAVVRDLPVAAALFGGLADLFDAGARR